MVLRGRALHALRVVAIAASVVGFNGVRPATHPRHAPPQKMLGADTTGRTELLTSEPTPEEV